MKVSTAYNHRERALQSLAEMYQHARMFGMTAQAMNERRVEILKSINHCPGWVLSYISGWERAISAEVYREQVFFYTMPDGSLVSSHRDRDDYYEKKGWGPREVYEQAIECGHYWIINGKPKPYSVSPNEYKKEVANAG